MKVSHITPILNVSSVLESFAWFEKWGWKRGFDWGEPPTFGAVCAEDGAEIFLCEGDQGGRGENGVWMSIWVDAVDPIYAHCLKMGIKITWPPTDEPWGVREMHIQHPDGHILRISQSPEE